MKPSEVLREFGWCQGKLAVDKNWSTVDVHRGNPVAFCLMGAIERSYGLIDFDTENAAKEKLRVLLKERFGTRQITEYNDRICESKEQAISILEEIGE